jgi:predicted HTH domain antitoxin
METIAMEVPADVLRLLERSRLRDRPSKDQVRTALAIHLFQEGVISLGKAAAIAGVPRVEFELLLVDMGIWVARYDEREYERDLAGLAGAERRAADRRAESPDETA